MNRGRPLKHHLYPDALLAAAKVRERIQWFMEHQIWKVTEEELAPGGPVQMTAEMTVKGAPVALTVFSLPDGDLRSVTRLHLDLMMAQHLVTQT